MSHCIHDWSYGPDAEVARNLLAQIKATGKKGRWIKDGEMDLAKGLIKKGKIVMCSTCDRSATAV